MRRIRETRGGELYESSFGVRGRGEGPYADATFALFERLARRLGLRTTWMEPALGDAEDSGESKGETTFVRPDTRKQLTLF
jgi:hypothetical protein